MKATIRWWTVSGSRLYWSVLCSLCIQEIDYSCLESIVGYRCEVVSSGDSEVATPG